MPYNTLVDEVRSKPVKQVNLNRTEQDWEQVKEKARKVKVYHGVYPVVPSRRRKKKV